MKNKAYIKPTKPSLIIGLIAVSAMLVFGIYFMITLANEGAGIGVGFMAIWFLFLLLIGGSFVKNLIAKDGEGSIGQEVTFKDTFPKDAGHNDFDESLRKLEELFKEKLITEAEYQSKRKEILDRI